MRSARLHSLAFLVALVSACATGDVGTPDRGPSDARPGDARPGSDGAMDATRDAPPQDTGGGPDGAEDAGGGGDGAPVDTGPMCVDMDGDGYGTGPGCRGPDCNDMNRDANPGAMETCNGGDDDCDGMTDEDLGTSMCGAGACARTVNNCEGGRAQTCTPGTPGAETCNGMDDDCDGMTDEDLGTQNCGVGACRREAPACVGGMAGACTPGTPGTESCNGMDDDCDGMTDEDFGGVTCGVGACQRTSSSCSGGMTGTCTPGTPSPETCNGMDDDCDGMTDEDLPPLMCGTGACARTVPSCTGGTPQTCTPGPTAMEVCNNIDDDCDGAVDEGVTQSCYGGAPGTAGRGVCRAGTQTCTAGGFGPCVGEVLPGTEVCNDVDDDCNGAVDDGLTRTCYSGPIGTAGTGRCRAGSQTCMGGGFGACVGEVVPGVEMCNGQDDDCNGVVDEGISRGCYTGPAGTQNVGACRGGTQSCSGGTFGACLGEVRPTAEACNGVDDDCDGMTDEALSSSCYAGPAGTQGVGICRAGTQTCSGGTPGPCTGQVLPRAETCNALDDDCDGMTDEGISSSCYTGPAGTQGVGQCRAGTQTCTGGAPGACMGQVLPGVEVCNGVDDDCDGMTDEGISRACYTGPAGTQGVGICRAGTQTCVSGSFGACQGEVLPRAETCNSVDDDCDAMVDEGACGPVNETCSAAAAYTIGATVASTTAGTANNHTASCGLGAGSPDVAYRFTSDGGAFTYVISSTTSSHDGLLHVHNGAACSGATEIGCNDDFTGTRDSRVTLDMLPQGTFYIVQDGYSTGNAGTFTLTSSRTAINNDTCAGAARVRYNGRYVASTAGRAANYTATCGAGSNTAPDIVYVITATRNSTITVNTAGSSYDTILYVGTTCGGATQGCNDDTGGTLQSSVSWAATAGTTYYVIVDGYAGASGSVVLNVSGL